MLQRPGGGGGGQPSGDRRAGGPGAQRQAADRADTGADRYLARGHGRAGAVWRTPATSAKPMWPALRREIESDMRGPPSVEPAASGVRWVWGSVLGAGDGTANVLPAPFANREGCREPSPPAIPPDGVGVAALPTSSRFASARRAYRATGAYDRSVRARRERHGRIMHERLSGADWKAVLRRDIGGPAAMSVWAERLWRRRWLHDPIVYPPSYVIDPAVYDRSPMMPAIVRSGDARGQHNCSARGPPLCASADGQGSGCPHQNQSRQIQLRDGRSGVAGHLVGEMLRQSLDLDLVHIPYNSAGLAIGSTVACKRQADAV